MADPIELLSRAAPTSSGRASRAPRAAQREAPQVGPFIFFDHFGHRVTPGATAWRVRPHPHIGLATVTYLFDAESSIGQPGPCAGDPARRRQTG